MSNRSGCTHSDRTNAIRPRFGNTDRLGRILPKTGCQRRSNVAGGRYLGKINLPLNIRATGCEFFNQNGDERSRYLQPWSLVIDNVRRTLVEIFDTDCGLDRGDGTIEATGKGENTLNAITG